MQKFHVKSILLGIGMGIVLTSMISLVYVAGADSSPKLTEAEVVTLAEKYGMVKNTTLLKSDKEQTTGEAKANGSEKSIMPNESIAANKDNQNENTGKVTENKPTENIVPNSKPVETAQPEVKIQVEYGDTAVAVAEKLLEAGLIANSEDFGKEIKEQRLQSYIRVGEYTIKMGTDVKDIIKIITKRK